MHYQHRYHAGNFADVFKHLLLIGLLQGLNRKDKPWLYLETHAGAGRYDLRDDAATRTAEWQDGIGRLWGARSADPLIGKLLEIVAAENSGQLQWYPGSPRIAATLARPGDRLVLCEKVPQVAAELRYAGKDLTVHVRDGYEAHSLLPPPEKRGLVLIDPPFEARDEFDTVAEFLSRALARFAGGVFAVWYPVKNRHEAQRFVRRVQRETTQPLLDLQFDSGAHGEGQLRACGLLVINPPFRFAEAAGPALDELARKLAQGRKAAARIEWLRSDE
ncbi:MAG TPA: 23S rRNA (adenine(2030)-N(6))-methyltransferase RlmJ [Solimonas sp.]|nr:23S rRNA (adenine(2030)-N(6))-methyltransferase RlmJ [Solimonas sp.]